MAIELAEWLDGPAEEEASGVFDAAEAVFADSEGVVSDAFMQIVRNSVYVQSEYGQLVQAFSGGYLGVALAFGALTMAVPVGFTLLIMLIFRASTLDYQGNSTPATAALDKKIVKLHKTYTRIISDSKKHWPKIPHHLSAMFEAYATAHGVAKTDWVKDTIKARLGTTPNDVKKLTKQVDTLNSDMYAHNMGVKQSAIFAYLTSVSLTKFVGMEAAPGKHSLKRLLDDAAAAIVALRAAPDKGYKGLHDEVSALHFAVYGKNRLWDTVNALVRDGKDTARGLREIGKRVTALEDAPPVQGGISKRQAQHLDTAYTMAIALGSLAGIAPLTALQTANLNKLKNNPCQCKGAGGGVPSADTIASDDLFLTQGI